MIRSILLVSLACLAATAKSQQHLFILEPRELRASLRNQYTQTSNRMELGFKENTVPTLTRYQLHADVHYGLSKRVTLDVSLGLFEASSLNRQIGAESGNEISEGDSHANMSDHEVGANVLLFASRTFQLSSFVRFGIPAGNSARSSGLLTGDGEWDQAVGLQVARRSPSKRWVTSLEVNYRHRGKGFSSDIQYNVFAGFAARKWLWVQLHHRGTQTLYNTPYFNADGSLIGGSAGLYANNTTFYTIEPSVYFELGGRWGLAAGFSYLLTGENTYKALAPLLVLHWGINPTAKR